jgi:hypothetical protein
VVIFVHDIGRDLPLDDLREQRGHDGSMSHSRPTSPT